MSSSRTETSSVQVVMPQMGVSVAEGTIIEWTKRPGDWVERDETVCLVTTDKIDVEIPSPASGRLERILIEPGDTVDVGTPLAELDADARRARLTPRSTGRSSLRPRAGKDVRDGPLRLPLAGGQAHGRGARHRPLEVRGTGIGGRIRKRDLVALIESRPGESPAESTPRAERPFTSSPRTSRSPLRRWRRTAAGSPPRT